MMAASDQLRITAARESILRPRRDPGRGVGPPIKAMALKGRPRVGGSCSYIPNGVHSDVRTGVRKRSRGTSKRHT